ncbi:MAG: hypothetical protein IJA81_03490 [Akkermansia sp.]|nr:hypothetical protein [Akkermansia sp.]
MNIDFSSDKHRLNALQYWNGHDFFAPDTVVLGLDIGIEGIGITIRKGQEWIYSKSLLVDLPEAEALATRRAFRASRHARKNRKTRMRRLKALFEKHGLPWVNDDIMSRTDPFKLRYRAINGKLASKEALSICIRSCVLRRGYDYFAMNDDDASQSIGNTQEMPWGTGTALTDAKQWVSSAYVDKEMMDFLIKSTPMLTHNNKELKQEQVEDWVKLVQARHKVADKEGIAATLEKYVKNKINEKKARGKNYPRAHVKEHLTNIIHRHADLIENADSFEAALFRPCLTWEDKQHAIFHYNRKTPKEASRHYQKKVKQCPYCDWLGLPSEKCGVSGDIAIRCWKLIDFVSVRTFELQAGKLPAYRAKLPEGAIQALMNAITGNVNKWADAKKQMEEALKKMNLKLASGEWNKAQTEQLKDIVAPAANLRHGRASMSVSAAKAMVDAATCNGNNYNADSMELWKKDSGLYLKRAEIDACGGIYPQVQTLLGTLKKQTAEFSTLGFLQRLFLSDKLQEKLGGKTAPDYCIIECIKNAAINTKQAKEIQKAQEENRKRREKLAELFNKTNCSHAEQLRMKLYTEQGGTDKKPAICPFTGIELAKEDLFSAKFQLAHIYPDSRGGLYMADNLVLTTAEINKAMDNRTPAEAAEAALPGWLSWEEMLKQSSQFSWSEAKRKIFSFIPNGETSFPDFNNTTRTAQLAREFRRMAAIWMGIAGDSEAIRTHIGNPCGVYTAAARRSFLSPDYNKDRSDNRHHRLDAAVMSCLPPDGMNDVLYRGIFQTEIDGKNRRLMCIEGLDTPDFQELLHDGEECPIVKINSRSKYKSLGDSTFWSVDNKGLTHQRTPLSPDKVKTAGELYDILKRMGIPSKDIPSEKKLESWLIDCQAATKADKNATPKPLKLNNGTPVKNIWKFGSKGNLDNSPLGWNGIITPENVFDQLRSLSASNDRLELWLGWNTKKKRWEYYKKLIPTAAALAGLKRMGLPWRGTKNAPRYLLEILAKNKAKDLHEMISGKLPPHAVKVGNFRKGDVFLLNFEVNSKYVEKLQKSGNIDMLNHPKAITTWGHITALGTAKYVEFKAISLKDRKSKMLNSSTELAILIGLPPDASEYAFALKLNSPL